MKTPSPIQLCRGSVRHTRLRPKRNQFSYGVYYLRLPLRALACAPHLAVAFFSINRFNLLSFHTSDHGDGSADLLAWVEQLLHTQGIDDATGEIWLQTFPRVLGFVFNPVSFFFCQRHDGSLRAVLCEVHNTFGEKHFYLLTGAETIANGQELSAHKVFHVSPFCTLEGFYRFRFLQTSRHSASPARGLARIDYHDPHGLLLQTSISGTSAPLDSRGLLGAFMRYPLMTWGVICRIHWQALRLWLKRVPFFSKPPEPAQKITR